MFPFLCGEKKRVNKTKCNKKKQKQEIRKDMFLMWEIMHNRNPFTVYWIVSGFKFHNSYRPLGD